MKETWRTMSKQIENFGTQFGWEKIWKIEDEEKLFLQLLFVEKFAVKEKGGKSKSITQPQMACQRGINLFLRAGERQGVGVDIGANLAQLCWTFEGIGEETRYKLDKLHKFQPPFYRQPTFTSRANNTRKKLSTKSMKKRFIRFLYSLHTQTDRKLG